MTCSRLPRAPSPFGGVRLYAKDHQQGRSITFCLTMPYVAGPYCCTAEPQVDFPGWMRKNAQSMRLVKANECEVFVNLYDDHLNHHLRRSIQRYAGTSWRQKGIPDGYDNTATQLHGLVACWEATTRL